MPKQRHHQHQRRRGVPLTGLRLPHTTFIRFQGIPDVRFPDGWVTRPLNLRLLVLVYVGAAAAIAALAGVAAVVLWLFGGH
jgi:hypothetical protein